MIMEYIPFADLSEQQQALVISEDWKTRKFAAEQGLGLDVLANDPSYDVRFEVVRHGGYEAPHSTSDDFAQADDIWAIINDVAGDAVAKTVLEVADALVVYGYVPRQAAAELHEMYEEGGLGPFFYEDDMLLNTRDTIADWIYDQFPALPTLEQFESTCTPTPKEPVKEQGLDKYIEQLSEHENEYVRAAVAELGLKLNELISDPDYHVRIEVAYQGFGLDVLINDEDWEVRTAADGVLEHSHLTLEEWIKANPDKCALPENREPRVPGELKSAGKAPKQPVVEAATPGKDEQVVKQSAAARGVESQAHEVKRQK